MSRTITNPVLPGFHPDPSFLRVGDDYYLATSTFEWFPGVRIHHSRDLVNWRLLGHALTRDSQVELRGVTDSGGVWAPSLSYAEGLFWLIYTNVRTRVGAFKDVGVFLATAPDILGPWSEPVFLNSIGFDPSLFHDDDGRKWIVNMMWDHRPGRNRFAGIVLQEYNHARRSLVGPMKNILAKAELTEGPNLYKRNGWYYLMLAEGGTGWNHGISMARSRAITGPYELDPEPSVLTARDKPSLSLQKAGHGELIATPQGEWFLAHLASRPIGPKRRCMLGRETCVQRVVWSADGWLRLAHGGHHPRVNLPAPLGLTETKWPLSATRDEFDSPELDAHWCALRRPADESWLTLSERPGWLRLRGRESLHSLFEQSLIARRLTSVRCVAETRVDFSPKHFTQSAGLICWYDTRTHYYLRVTFDENRGRVLGIVFSDDGVYDEIASSSVPIAHANPIRLRATMVDDALQFSASLDESTWFTVGPQLDASKLSDDYGTGLHFTGAFVGLCAQDLSGADTWADFDYFSLVDTRND